MFHIKFLVPNLKFPISERGVSLYLAVVILSIILAITLGLGAILVQQTITIKEMGDSVAAFYAADTGAERILYEDKLCRMSGCDGLSWFCVDAAECDEGRSSVDSPVSGSVGQATYQIIFNDGATNITSIGTYSGARRAIGIAR